MPQHRCTIFTMLAAGVAVLTLLQASNAQPGSAAHIQDVSIGLADVSKVGYWTPVRISVRAGAEEFTGQLSITTKDRDGVTVTYLDNDPVHIAPNSETIFTRYVKFGQLGSDLRVELLTGGQTISARLVAADDLPMVMPSSRDWVVTLGPDAGVAKALKASRVTEITDTSTLPTEWFGYEGVNTVFISTSDIAALEAITAEQFSALEQWVTLGGRVVMCVGSAGENAIGQGKPLSRLTPGTFSRVQTVRNLTALETYVASSQSLDAIRADGRTMPLQICILDNVRGRTSVYEQAADRNRPIVIRAPTGLGQVVFMAAALDEPPFSDWADRSRLIERLFQGDIDQQQEHSSASGPTGQLVHLGYDDLAGQLRAGAEQFSGVALIPFAWVAGLIVLYILLIGPADYFFLRDVLHRMSWTWLTFPFIAVLFCALALVLHAHFKATNVKLNQIDLVDIDLERSTTRGTTWLHLYSPSSASYSLQLTSSWLKPESERVSDTGCLLSWHGLPGKGLGGLEAKSATLFHSPYKIELTNAETKIAGTPIEIGGTKAFQARWWSNVELESNADLHLDSGGLLRGSVVNPLRVELYDCVLLYENWAYKLDRKGGVLGPGDNTPIHLEKPLNFSWRLTRRRVVDIKDITTPWEQGDGDVPRILEMMMFHRIAGGDRYTQLQHRYQNYVDLSEHLTNGRAILLGQAKQAASDLRLNEQAAEANYDRRWTYYRVVFPVEASHATSPR